MPKENLIITATIPLPDDDFDKIAAAYLGAKACIAALSEVLPGLGGTVEHSVELATQARGRPTNGAARKAGAGRTRAGEPPQRETAGEAGVLV